MKFNKNIYIPYKDQFNYYNLIKKINPFYRLFFNRKSKRFEIININKNYETCKSFDAFSGNILQDLRFSRIENYNKILEFIDNENEKLTKINEQKNNYILKSTLNDFQQLNNRSKTISKTDINKTIGAAKC